MSACNVDYMTGQDISFFNLCKHDAKTALTKLTQPNQVNIFTVHNGTDYNALHFACMNTTDNVNDVWLLINTLCDRGVSINLVGLCDYTPLITAFKYGNEELCYRLLTNLEVNVNVKDNEGETFLSMVVVNGSTRLFNLLIQRKDLNTTYHVDSLQLDPLYLAVNIGFKAAVVNLKPLRLPLHPPDTKDILINLAKDNKYLHLISTLSSLSPSLS
jgi:ankyrin repeat protein